MYIHTINIYMLKSIFKFLMVSTFFLALAVNTFAQNYELKVFTKDSIHTLELHKISYPKIHKNIESAYAQLDTISYKLSKIGYLQNEFQATLIDSVLNCEFTLHQKTAILRIYYNEKSLNENFLKTIALNTTDSYFEIPFEATENVLKSIVNYYENLGYTFTTVTLTNLLEQQNSLNAQLQVNISNKRTINNVVIKGYPEFPKKYLKHYLGIQPNETFNLGALNELNDLINTIPFVNQIKKPEVLFTKDSTTLYLYLKKKSTSSFDGIIGFSNEEKSKGLTFNGYLDLSLNNILNKGESFSIQWENSQQKNSSLLLNFNTPYLFNSKINFNGSFSIFKQDTSYVNTKGILDLGYELNKNNSAALNFITEKSNLSSINNTANIQNFNKNLVGISYQYYLIEKPVYINRYKFKINTEAYIGNRISNNIKTKQYVFNLFAEYTAHLNFRNAIYIKNSTQILDTKNPFENELFRIGGIHSLRGFDEQSIFTAKYNITNLEYQYNVNNDSYLYTISDFAILNNINTNTTTQLYGLGLGYFLSTKRTILNLSYAVGTNYDASFNINNSKVHIKITYPF